MKLIGDTAFLAEFGTGWKVVAAACTHRAASRTTARSREPDVRLMFVAYLLVVVTGLVLFAMAGALHR